MYTSKKTTFEKLLQYPLILLICRTTAALLAAGSIGIAAWINTRPEAYRSDLGIETSMGMPPYEFYWYGPQLCISLLFNTLQIYFLIRHKRHKLWPGCVALIDAAIMVWLFAMVVLFLSTMAALDTVVIQAIPAMLCGLLHGALSVYSCCNAPICCCDSIRRRRYSRADPSDAFGSQVGGTMVERPLDAPPAYRSEVGTTNIVGVPSVQYV